MPLFYFISYIVQLVTISGPICIISYILIRNIQSPYNYYQQFFLLYSFGVNSFRSTEKQRKKTNVPCHADRYHAKTLFAIVAKHIFCRYTVVYNNTGSQIHHDFTVQQEKKLVLLVFILVHYNRSESSRVQSFNNSRFVLVLYVLY